MCKVLPVAKRGVLRVALPALGKREKVVLAKAASALLAAVLVLGACTAPASNGGTTATSNKPDQVVLSIVNHEDYDGYDVSATRTVVWRAPGDMEQSSVYLIEGVVSADDTAWAHAIEIAGELTPAAEMPDNYGNYRHFEASITGLIPGDYSYLIGAAGGIDPASSPDDEPGSASESVRGATQAIVERAFEMSEPATFTVRGASETRQSSIFLFFGDTQPEASIEEYADFGALVQTARAAYPQADLALQCGDMGNQGNAPEEWAAFLREVSPVFSGLPLFTAPGNHEISPYVNTSGRKPAYYLGVFALPRNGPAGFEEEYYSFDYGDAHILSLSSNYLDPAETYSDDEAEASRIAAEIDQWIESDLANTKQTWKIVLMHQPAYPLAGDSTAAGMANRWIPIFDRTGVDLVLCGHQHEFMRTWPLRAGAEDANGLVQVMGNASRKSYATSGSDLPFVAFEMGGVMGWHTITLMPHEIIVEAFDSTGRALDVWMKQK
jgi:predicted MPP superfamily phosphohydrolase